MKNFLNLLKKLVVFFTKRFTKANKLNTITSGIKMNKIDKLSKEVLNLFLYTKDHVKAEVTSHFLKEDHGINEKQLAAVLRLIDSSIEQSYEKGIHTFQKTASHILDK